MRQRGKWDPVDGIVFFPPDSLEQTLELARPMEIAIMLARFRAVHDNILDAERFQFPNRILAFGLGEAVHTGSNLIAQVEGHACGKARLEAATDLRNFEPGVEAEPYAARGEYAAFGLERGQLFRDPVFNRAADRRGT